MVDSVTLPPRSLRRRSNHHHRYLLYNAHILPIDHSSHFELPLLSPLRQWPRSSRASPPAPPSTPGESILGLPDFLFQVWVLLGCSEIRRICVSIGFFFFIERFDFFLLVAEVNGRVVVVRSRAGWARGEKACRRVDCGTRSFIPKAVAVSLQFCVLMIPPRLRAS